MCSKLFSHHLGNLSGQSQANPGVFDLKPKGFKGFTVVFHQLATSRWPVQACWTFGAKPCCWTPLHCICSVTGKVGPFLGRISVPSDEMASRFAIKWGIPNGLWWCLQMIYSYIYICVCVYSTHYIRWHPGRWLRWLNHWLVLAVCSLVFA